MPTDHVPVKWEGDAEQPNNGSCKPTKSNSSAGLVYARGSITVLCNIPRLAVGGGFTVNFGQAARRTDRDAREDAQRVRLAVHSEQLLCPAHIHKSPASHVNSGQHV